MTPLENALEEVRLIELELAKSPIDIERVFLIGSGIKDEGVQRLYKRKIEQIHNDFLTFVGNTESLAQHEIASGLLDYIHHPRRKLWGHSYLFHQTLDNWLDANAPYVGECCSLAAFYYVLGRRSNLNLKFIDMEFDNISDNIISGHSMLGLEDHITIDPQCPELLERDSNERIMSLRDFIHVAYINRTDTVQWPQEKSALCAAAINISPNRPEAYSEFATIHIKYEGDYNLATKLCRKAIELGGHNPAYLLNLASAHIKAGRKGIARSIVNEIKGSLPSAILDTEMFQKLCKEVS